MEEIRNHIESNVSFVLRIRKMVGNAIYLNNITSSHTLLMDYIGVPEDPQRLLFGRNIMENDNILEVYNVNDHSILMVMRFLRGVPRTRCTRDLTPALIDTSSEISNTSEYFFAENSEAKFTNYLLTLQQSMMYLLLTLNIRFI